MKGVRSRPDQERSQGRARHERLHDAERQRHEEHAGGLGQCRVDGVDGGDGAEQCYIPRRVAHWPARHQLPQRWGARTAMISAETAEYNTMAFCDLAAVAGDAHGGNEAGLGRYPPKSASTGARRQRRRGERAEGLPTPPTWRARRTTAAAARCVPAAPIGEPREALAAGNEDDEHGREQQSRPLRSLDVSRVQPVLRQIADAVANAGEFVHQDRARPRVAAGSVGAP